MNVEICLCLSHVRKTDTVDRKQMTLLQIAMYGSVWRRVSGVTVFNGPVPLWRSLRQQLANIMGGQK